MNTENRPRIIEVVDSWPAETFLHRHFESLNANRYPIIVVARFPISNSAQASSIEEITSEHAFILPGFRYFSLKELALSLQYLLFKPKYLFMDRSIHNLTQLALFARLKPDLIHFHNGWIAARMNWIPIMLGVPYTLSLRGHDIQVYPLRSKKTKYKVVHAIENASGIHSVCNQFRTLSKELVLDSTEPVTIYTPVSIPKQQAPLIVKSSNSLSFFSSGRLMWRKGYPDLLRAIADLGKGGLDVHLTIAGSGQDEDRVYYWIKKLGLVNNVLLIGKVDQERSWEEIRKSDAYIQASIAEGLSNSMAEALANGCPVFATDVGGTKEIIKDGENGFLLPALCPEAWSEKLELVQDSELMKRISIAGYQTAVQFFNPDTHARQFIDFYNSVLDNSIRGKPNVARPNDVSSTRNAPDRKVLIKGKWDWRTGADLVLRALARAVEPKSISISILGEGPQDDELRYLAYYLGFGSADFKMGGYADELKKAYLCISLPESPEGNWTITQKSFHRQIPFGDCDRLTNVLADYLVN